MKNPVNLMLAVIILLLTCNLYASYQAKVAANDAWNKLNSTAAAAMEATAAAMDAKFASEKAEQASKFCASR